MKSNFTVSLMRAAMAALLFVTVGCGSNNTNSTATATPTPIVTATPTPTPNAGDSITCTAATLAVGVKVFYSGTKGTTFPDAKKAYTGTALILFYTGTAQVHWDDAAVPDNDQAWSVLMTEATCSTDLTGRTALYTAAQSAANANFPDPKATYLGAIVKVFAGGNAQVKWNHLSYDTVESFSDIAISQ